MAVPVNAILYAREVYAACATVGFDDASARRLKALLDEYEAGNASFSGDELMTIAQRAQRASIEWVTADPHQGRGLHGR